MADAGKGGRVRDPLEEGEDKANRMDTPANREESMTESDDEGRQSTHDSGTTPLGGESRGSSHQKGPGGVEGTE